MKNKNNKKNVKRVLTKNALLLYKYAQLNLRLLRKN